MVFGFVNKKEEKIEDPRKHVMGLGDKFHSNGYVLVNSGLDHGELVLSVYYTEVTSVGFTFKSFVYNIRPIINSTFNLGDLHIVVKNIAGNVIAFESSKIASGTQSTEALQT